MSQEDATARKRQILAETRFLRLIQEGHWTYAQRPNITGAIAIIAVTSADELLLVDQYRIPVGGRVIELPAGLVGDLSHSADETLEDAAQRELREEVGYEAARLRVLSEGVSSAGLTDESVHLVLAEDVRQVGPGGGDASEDILVCHVPLSDVASWLVQQQQQGKHVDFKVYAGLYHLLLRRNVGFLST